MSGFDEEFDMAAEDERAMAEYEYYAQGFHPDVDAHGLAGVGLADKPDSKSDTFNGYVSAEIVDYREHCVISEAALPSENAATIVRERNGFNGFRYSNFAREVADKWLVDRLAEYDGYVADGKPDKATEVVDAVMMETYLAEETIHKGGIAIEGYMPVQEGGVPMHARAFSDKMYKELYDRGFDTRPDSNLPVFDGRENIFMTPAEIVAQTKAAGCFWMEYQQDGVDAWMRDLASLPFSDDQISAGVTEGRGALLAEPGINPAGFDLMSKETANFAAVRGFLDEGRVVDRAKTLQETQRILSEKQGLSSSVMFDATRHPIDTDSISAEQMKETQRILSEKQALPKSVDEAKRELNEKYGTGDRRVDVSHIHGNEQDGNEFAK